MNRAIANAVRNHLEATGHHMEVGKRPDEVEGELPYGIVYVSDSDFENNDDDQANVDRAGDHMMHLQVWGTTHDSAGLLAQDLDDRMSVSGIDPDGHVVTLVKRERQSGPRRDDDLYPEPSRFRVDMWFVVWTEDSTA